MHSAALEFIWGVELTGDGINSGMSRKGIGPRPMAKLAYKNEPSPSRMLKQTVLL